MKAPVPVIKRQRREVARWHRDNPLDVDTIIRMMRNNERGGRVHKGPVPG